MGARRPGRREDLRWLLAKEDAYRLMREPMRKAGGAFAPVPAADRNQIINRHLINAQIRKELNAPWHFAEGIF
jgi:hypothetical protein